MFVSLKMKKLTKSFPDKLLFDGVDFNFRPGCYALLGANGVGKTTILEMLAGVSRQDSGEIYLSDTGDNFSLTYKQKLAYVPSKALFFPMATGREFLRFVSSAKKITPRLDHKLNDLLKKFNLTDYLDKKFNEMSFGTQKKLFLSTIAIGNNSLIVIDEPTVGLDEISNFHLTEMLSELSKTSIVIMATHDEMLLKKLQPYVIQLNCSPVTFFKNDLYKENRDEVIL